MPRITQAHMQAQVEIVNNRLGLDADDNGAVQLSGAYGGWAVHLRNGAGVSDLTGGHAPARETSTFLSGMIAALRIAGPQV